MSKAAIMPTAIEDPKMLKVVLSSIAIASLLATATISASAFDMLDCTDANMVKANADIDKMAASEKKTRGMKEMILAKEMMEKKDMTACKLHLNKAIEMGMSK